jgi:hypothetical protein
MPDRKVVKEFDEASVRGKSGSKSKKKDFITTIDE